MEAFLEIPEKLFFPKVLIFEEESLIFCREEQPLKAFAEIEVTFLLRETDFNFLHLAKAFFPMAVILYL